MTFIVYSPDQSIFGVQQADDYSIGSISVGESPGTTNVLYGDATYSVPSGVPVTIPVTPALLPVTVTSLDGILNPSPGVFTLDPTTFSRFIPGTFAGGFKLGPTITDSQWPARSVEFTDGWTDRRVSLPRSDPFVANRLTAPFRGSPLIGESFDESLGRPTVVSLTPGSLAAHVTFNMNAMIAGKSPSPATVALYTSRSGNNAVPLASAVAVRSTTHIAAAYDLSFISAWRGVTSERQLPGILITPEHIWTSHVLFAIGEQIGFVDNSNVLHIRTIVARVGGINGGIDGWSVSRLSSPITAISPVKIAPFNILSYLPSLRYYRRFVPCLVAGNNMPHGSIGGLGIRELSIISEAGVSTQFVHAYPLTDPMFAWGWNAILGDSNNPIMLPVNGELILIGTEFTGTSGVGLFGTPDLTFQPLEHFVTQAGGISQITRANFSMFPTYPDE